MKDFDITFKWIGAPTWILQVDDLKIACDPVLCPKDTLQIHPYFKVKRRTAPQFVEKDFSAIDFWLLTHQHEDHIDAYGVTKIDPNSKVFSHHNLKKWLKLIYAKNVTFLPWGKVSTYTKNDLQVAIEAIPCVHASNFIAAKLAGGVNGYWVTIKKGKNTLNIYVTGDTVAHTKVKKFLNGRKADILIPNVGGGGLNKFGGPYTFTAETLKDIVATIQPSAILPVHHTSFSIYKDPIQNLYDWNDERILQFDEGDTITL